MVKEKRILSYFLGWFIIGFIVCFIGITDVKALTLDTQDITWYYRKTSDETTLLNTIKNIDTPLHIVNGEYMNGFTTRQDYTFNKDIQYMINYKLIYRYYEGLDGSFRSDTVDRLISYSWIDSDFKLLNSNVNQTKYLCESDLCTREFTISQQVLTLNNTSGIRFGVYTTEAKSLGFYSPSSGNDGVYITLSSYISIEDNSSSTIIDQNNQIINGQNSLQNSITNTEDNINQNIDDMEDAIIDSNNQTQEVIKDQFNTCRDSYNLFNSSKINTLNKNGITVTINEDGSLHFKGTATALSDFYFYSATDKLKLKNNTTYTLSRNTTNGFNLIWHKFNSSDATSDVVYMSNTLKNYTYTTNSNDTGYRFIIRIPSGTTIDEDVKIQLQEGNISTSYEPFGEEICSNKLDDTNDKLDGIQGALTDTSSPNMEILGDSAGWLPPGPLDSVLNLPLTMMNNLLTNLGKTCSTLRVELPFVNKNIEIPCVESLMEQMGALSIWRWVGRIASVIILYSYLMNLYAWADKVLTLRAELDEAMGADLANWGRL